MVVDGNMDLFFFLIQLKIKKEMCCFTKEDALSLNFLAFSLSLLQVLS